MSLEQFPLTPGPARANSAIEQPDEEELLRRLELAAAMADIAARRMRERLAKAKAAIPRVSALALLVEIFPAL